MTQFIQYLYEYEQGERVRNVGFMKVEKQMDKSVIQIYAKQIDEIKGILFERENGEKYVAAWEACEVPQNAKTVCEEKTYEEPEAYVTPNSRMYEKIQRQDLSRLPRREWKLANNSFLLHGFYNYHHLLYIEEEGQIWIGVPGIYHEKEKAAANAFGFTEFQRLADVEVELSDEEQNTYEEFGYWCRKIESSSV